MLPAGSGSMSLAAAGSGGAKIDLAGINGAGGVPDAAVADVTASGAGAEFTVAAAISVAGVEFGFAAAAGIPGTAAVVAGAAVAGPVAAAAGAFIPAEDALLVVSARTSDASVADWGGAAAADASSWRAATPVFSPAAAGADVAEAVVVKAAALEAPFEAIVAAGCAPFWATLAGADADGGALVCETVGEGTGAGLGGPISSAAGASAAGWADGGEAELEGVGLEIGGPEVSESGGAAVALWRPIDPVTESSPCSSTVTREYNRSRSLFKVSIAEANRRVSFWLSLAIHWICCACRMRSAEAICSRRHPTEAWLTNRAPTTAAIEPAPHHPSRHSERRSNLSSSAKNPVSQPPELSPESSSAHWSRSLAIGRLRPFRGPPNHTVNFNRKRPQS